MSIKPAVSYEDNLVSGVVIAGLLKVPKQMEWLRSDRKFCTLFTGEATLRGEPRMQTISTVVTNHRTGPSPIGPNKRKHTGDQLEDDINCDNERVAKMSLLFAAQL
ncbi:hypothetical protein AAFF_G00147980 [Aldrovandia affinis]|uniref:Uncharacterized protein n=1 Tax=Aldrovandia affinis TaxID=143900 RepID=A0AAD7RPQ0_9TELE|nr:hypothetical protein AAFF_G00147980 [Aldrovandia affinis]